MQIHSGAANCLFIMKHCNTEDIFCCFYCKRDRIQCSSFVDDYGSFHERFSHPKSQTQHDLVKSKNPLDYKITQANPTRRTSKVAQSPATTDDAGWSTWGSFLRSKWRIFLQTVPKLTTVSFPLTEYT